MATLFNTFGGSVEVEIRDDLDALQELVGGYVQFVHMKDGSAFMVNEEGRLRGMAVNTVASEIAALKGWTEPFVGPVVFLSRKEMETIE